jgi:hypothetical protein
MALFLVGITHQIIKGHDDGIHDFEFKLELLLNGIDGFRDKQ